MHVSNISVLGSNLSQYYKDKYARSDWPRGVSCLHESIVNIFVASRCFAFRALIMPSQARI